MRFDLTDFFTKYKYAEDKKAYFSGFSLQEVFYHRRSHFVVYKIKNVSTFPYRVYRDLREYLTKLTDERTSLYIKAEDGNLAFKEAVLYFRDYVDTHPGSFSQACLTLGEDKRFLVRYPDLSSYQYDEDNFADLQIYFQEIGFAGQLDFAVQKTKEHENSEFVLTLPKKTEMPDKKPEYKEKSNFRYGKRNYTLLKIHDLQEEMNDVQVQGKIFRVEERSLRTGSLVQTIYVQDEDDACIVKLMENKRFPKERMAENKEGRYATFSGKYRYDNFSADYIFDPDNIEFFAKDDALHDEEEEKRIELHTHSNKSEMDGVCDAAEIVEAAFTMGHKAVAITDHVVTQAFPICQRTARSLLKAHPDREFKILYGCEMNMVDPFLCGVYQPNDQVLGEQEYIVFDLETTGLSSRHDRIIEFGAVLMSRGNILQRKDFFLNPGRILPTHIRNLTNISQQDVDQARTFAQAKDEILQFIQGRVLVAHNASFDFGFLNEELKRLGEPTLNNPVIDTLDVARLLFKKRRTYRLGNIARQYGVDYDEEVAHRADYDAECLAKVFNLMLKDIQDKGISTLRELSELHGTDDFVKKNAYHTMVMCRDREGLRDLFRLVSISHTESLAVFGKANSKSSGSEFVAEPRILRETLVKYRKHLLLGSGCQNGEVFQIASTRSAEQLAKAISFYDYIEIQPLDNYRNLVEDRNSYSWEDIQQFQKDIIAEARKQGKIIVATGDVHYVREEEKIFRDVYINTQGIGGSHHPLFVYNKEKRAKQITPKQHFFTTREMLDAFAWLKDEKLIRDLVIYNPQKVADLCEEIMPIYDKLFTPAIEGSVEKLTEITYANAKERYGDPLPEEFAARIKRELESIIGNGYAVIYYVSHLLVKRSNEDGYLVGSRGSVGSSLVATMAKITEVNPMPPHYICPHCHHLEWVDAQKYASGYDLPDKKCPACGCDLIGDGQNIPFETFLGFHGDKVPDIDLNFSGDYQPTAHLFTREIFGEDHVFRAGTIGTVAEKTAFGYVSGYCEEKGITGMSRAQRQHLATGCEGVKRTTGQHPGGIIVIPHDMSVYDFTPVQYPANDPSASWKTTHFDFHEIHDNVLKFDILGHVDPTAMRQLETISGIDPKSIPMNDPETMSIFHSIDALHILNPDYHETTGACGLPEFGTRFVRGILEETRPSAFSDLVIISGLSHGTDVWNNNAKDLVDAGTVTLRSVIGCRDDIMLGLIRYGLPSKPSFDIMEKVRKGKGLSEEHEALMREHHVPEWYIDSCKKIKYMFPKAHAVAYVIMAVRIAWFKVHHPEYFYVSFFSLRCDAYEIETMIADADTIKKRMDEIAAKMQSRDREKQATKKEKDLYDTLEICYEMVSRGYHLRNIDLRLSEATNFRVNPENHHEIIPPFSILDGLGDNVAESIVQARQERDFTSKEDLLRRTQLSKTLCERFDKLGVLQGLADSDQTTLF